MSYDDLDTAIQALLKDEIDALVSNALVLKYMNNTIYPGQLIISDRYLVSNNMGIALQENSILKEAIDRSLLEHISRPYWQDMFYRYLGE